MQNYSFRPATRNDLEAIHQLITEQNKLDFGEPLRTVDDIRREWEAQNFNLELDSLVATAPNGQVAGYAELKDKEDVFIYLSSNYQDANLSSRLLELLENRIRSQKTSAEDSTEVWGRAGYRNPVLIETFEKSGYHSDISFLIMAVDLTEAPLSPKWPNDVDVRNFIPNQDEQATYETDEEAGKDKGYHNPLSYEQWSKRMGMDKKTFDPNIWFIAGSINEIAGVALNALGENAQVGWVDHLSVRRAWRNQGIGKALLLHTFGEFFIRGIRTIKLSVDSKSLTNAPRLYESVGMKTVEKYHIYKKAL